MRVPLSFSQDTLALPQLRREDSQLKSPDQACSASAPACCMVDLLLSGAAFPKEVRRTSAKLRLEMRLQVEEKLPSKQDWNWKRTSNQQALVHVKSSGLTSPMNFKPEAYGKWQCLSSVSVFSRASAVALAVSACSNVARRSSARVRPAPLCSQLCCQGFLLLLPCHSGLVVASASRQFWHDSPDQACSASASAVCRLDFRPSSSDCTVWVRSLPTEHPSLLQHQAEELP